MIPSTMVQRQIGDDVRDYQLKIGNRDITISDDFDKCGVYNQQTA